MKSLKLEEYEQLFELEGYFSHEDVENLKELTEENLRDMGITKRGKLYYQITVTSNLITLQESIIVLIAKKIYNDIPYSRLF